MAVLAALGRAMFGILRACEGQQLVKRCKLQEAGLAQGLPVCVQQVIGAELTGWPTWCAFAAAAVCGMPSSKCLENEVRQVKHPSSQLQAVHNEWG